MSKDVDCTGRQERIRSARLRQPLAELRRKRDRARRRDIWTQEDIDCAEAEAVDLLVKINFYSA